MTPLGEEVEMDRLEYYLSMFTIVHDGGQETSLKGLMYWRMPSSMRFIHWVKFPAWRMWKG